MFDPDGDQPAADTTRSSTSLDTGSSLNPRTARRLVTASYTSMIAYQYRPSVTHLLQFDPNPRGSYPDGRYPTKDVAGDRHMADGRAEDSDDHACLLCFSCEPRRNEPVVEADGAKAGAIPGRQRTVVQEADSALFKG